MYCAFVWLVAAYLTYCVGYENYNTKRILLNDQDVAQQIARMELSIQSLTQHVAQLTADTTKYNSEIESLKAELKAHRDADTGSTYIRWGRSSCSGSDVHLIYSGYAAGQHYNQHPNRFGGPANFLCMPSDPELSNVTLGGGSYIYGTEFKENILKSDSINEDVPCAVCKSTNTHTSIMIPGRHTCYSGWKLEYFGLLASDHFAYSASIYICVDRDPEYVPGGQEDRNGRLLFITKTKCGSLSCPPYKDDHAVNCVVCSQ